ncbi:hypothetical protein HYH02_008023 [Chlamydomonas schloesseri]|uniref:Uncharacterized protein n=1 Tax=Chlamydomonas schloesseri TaxID=2026947 RepID=A0A835WGR6_9CHLO|nr:hypothetical protein HYH02_008023 [Chlamydomonas schloesseri]|eukprot:KAG2446866.1 hypothetical protein HYH02_008023 [Chlamydomonas schloesseri]
MSSGSKARGASAKSPTRATGHAPQRDVSSGRDKRPSSAQKQPPRGLLGTTTTRDASLAGTTVVPSLVFPKGLLKPGSLQLPMPVCRPATSPSVSVRTRQPDARPAATSASSGVTAAAAVATRAPALETTATSRPASGEFAGPSAAPGAPAPASSPPYAILRQRSTSPPPLQPGRQGSSADDGATRCVVLRGATAGAGVGSGAVGSPHGGSRSGSPGPQHGGGSETRAGVPTLILNAEASAAASQSGTGTVNTGPMSPGRAHPRVGSPGRGGGPVATAGSPRAAAHRGSPRGSPKSPRGSMQRWGAGSGQPAGGPSSRSGSAGGASSGHTITRAAALRALKQQRSITPDRSAATATATATATVTTADGGGAAAGVGAFSTNTATASVSTTSATPCSKPVASTAGAVVADPAVVPLYEARGSGAGPKDTALPVKGAAGAVAATNAGVGTDEQVPETVHSSASLPAEADAKDSSAAAITGYAALRLGAARSPSPGARRTGQGAAAGEAALALASDKAGVLTERQQRAMRQHVQRQSSPSPHKGAPPGLAPAAGGGSSPAAQRLAGTPGALNNGGAGLPASGQAQGWQSDVVVAAKSRIKRLEDQVADLTAQLSGAKAARSEMQRQLEDLQRRNATTGPEALARELREAREQLKASASREAELAAALGRVKSANDGLAAQNKALYGTLDETLAAAEHAANELRQLRAAHTELKSAHAALQSDDKELQEELTLRERALSAVQAEYAALKRRHDDATAAAEAARRDAALRDGRLRREIEAAQAETAAVQQQLAKLQREHQQLHGRKAEKDKQLAAAAKRADTATEQLAAAERLAQEQAGLVRELESRSALLRNRNAVLDKAVATEKEARQAAEEQVRKLEEEIAVLVAVVRQSDPNLESLSGRLQLQGGRASGASAAALRSAAAASVAAAAAAAAGTSRASAAGADNADAGAVAEAGATEREEAELREFEAAEARAGAAGPMGRGSGLDQPGQESQAEPRHSLVTVTALAAKALPGPTGLTVRAPPPQPHQQRAASAPGAAANRARGPSPGPSPQAGTGYPAKHGMTGGVFLPGSPTAYLQYSPTSVTHARSPAGLLPPAPSLSPQLRAGGRARSAGAGAGGDGAAGRQRQRATSPSWANGAVMVDDEKEGGGLGIVGMRRARTPPGRLTAGARSRPQQSGSGSAMVAPRAPSPAWAGTGRAVARRAATPPAGRGSAAARRDTAGSGGGSFKPQDAPSPASTALSQAASAFSAAAAAAPGSGSGSGAMLMNPAAMGGVFWGNKRRANSGGGGSGGSAPRAARSDAGGILSDKAEAAAGSYAALSARRAMATSWLTTGAGVPSGSSGQRYSGSGAREPASAWRGSERSVSPAAAPSVRRAKTPEPMTAAAWAKAAGPRRRAATPDAIRLSSTGRGCYKPHPSAASGAAGSNGGATGSAASNGLAAILKPTAALFAAAHEPALSGSPGLQREPTFDALIGSSSGYESTAARASGVQDAGKGSGDDGADARGAGGIRLARAYYEQQSPPSRADTGGPAAGGGSAGSAGAGEMFRASYAFDASPPGSNPPAPAAAGGGPRGVSFGGVTHVGGGDNGSTQQSAAAGGAADADWQSGAQLPKDNGTIGTGGEPAADDMDAKSISAALRALQERQARLLQELTSSPAPAPTTNLSGPPGQVKHARQPPLPQPHHPSMPATGASSAAIPAAVSGSVPGSFSFPAPQPQSPLSESPASRPPSQHSPSPPSSTSKTPLPPVLEAPQESGYREAGMEAHWRASHRDGGQVRERYAAGGPHAATAGGGVAGGGVSKKRPASQQRVAPYFLQDDDEELQLGAEAVAGASAAQSWEQSGQALGAGVAQPSRDDLWWPGQNGPRAPAASAGARSQAGASAAALISPARTSRRPSVTEAAEAAVAAGAGVGGPLTALLGQLQAGDGAGGAPASKGTVVETHFSLASALSAVKQAQAQPRNAAAQEPRVPSGGAPADGAWGYAAADDEEVAEDGEDWRAAADESPRQQLPPNRPSMPHPALPHILQPKQHPVNQQQHHLGLSGSQPPSATAAAEGSFFGDDSIADAAGAPYSNAASPRLGVSLYDNHVYGDNSYSYGTAAAAQHGISNGGAAAAVDSVPPEMHVAAVREMYGLGGSSGGGATTAAAAAAAPGSAGATVSGGGGLPIVVGPVRIPTSIGHAAHQQHLPRSRLGESAAAAAGEHDEQEASSPPAQWVPLRMCHSSGASSPAIASSKGGGHDMSSGGADGAVPYARGVAARASDPAVAVAASAATAAAQATFEARMREAAVPGTPAQDQQAVEVNGDSIFVVNEDPVLQGVGKGGQHSLLSPATAGDPTPLAAAAADAMNKRQRLGSATGSDASAGNAAAQGAAPSLAASIAAALAGAGAGGGSPPRHTELHVPHPAMQPAAAQTGAIATASASSAGTAVDSPSGWGSTLLTSSGGGGPASSTVTAIGAPTSASNAVLQLGGSAPASAVRRSLQQGGTESSLLGAYASAAGPAATGFSGGGRSSSLSGLGGSSVGAVISGVGPVGAGEAYGRPSSPGVKPLSLAEVLRRSPSGGR